ncbi:MAG: hypothetical protein LBT48_06045 [Prevotellaceae bacterium]|nr:hypothetical protein [Prevotellaceae bacterium]
MIDIKDSQTLYTLHKHLQSDLNYAPDQMIVFRTLDKKGNEKDEYGLFDTGSGSIDKLTLAELKRRNELRLLYVFDLRNDRFLTLDCVEEVDEEPRRAYPFTSEEKGNPPHQFDLRIPSDSEDDDEDDDDEVEEFYDEEE